MACSNLNLFHCHIYKAICIYVIPWLAVQLIPNIAMVSHIINHAKKKNLKRDEGVPKSTQARKNLKVKVNTHLFNDLSCFCTFLLILSAMM